MKSKDNIIVRKLDQRDLSSLSTFLSRNALPEYSEDEYFRRFEFWWTSNPAFRSEDARGWIIEDINDPDYIKGFLGNIPVDYNINGNAYTSASPSTWIVIKKYKRFSLKLLFSFIQQNKDILINSTPGDLTEKIFSKLGFFDIAKNQNNYIYINNNKPIEYFLNLSIPRLKKINQILSKFGFFIYKTVFRKESINTKLNFEYQIISNTVEIAKLLEKKKVKLLNFNWVLKADPNKFFVKILNKDKSKNFMYIQYVDNPINKLKYFQILETDIISPILTKNVAIQIAFYHDYKIDFILIHNSMINNFFFKPFIKFNFLSRAKCLIKINKSNLEDIIPNGTFGEKGFVIWN